MVRYSMSEDSPPPPPPPPPAPHEVWGIKEGLSVHYLIRTAWQWVMDEVKKENMVEVPAATDLPSGPVFARLAEASNGNAEAQASTPLTRRSRRMKNNAKDKINGPSALKIEISEPDSGKIVFATHGTSSALDGLEDKDALVRTLQRCRCDHLNLSPPSVLINWDVTQEECHNVIGKGLPRLQENDSDDVVAVLKEPMGSQGQGIYFVRNVEEIHKVINEHRERAQKEPHFLDNLIAAKGRIPSWVLQAEVVPPLLIRDRRKFHIRTYLVVVENPQVQDFVDVYIYNRHEVRIAGVPMGDTGNERDPLAHITNGALSSTTERVLLHDVPELTSRNMQEKVEAFVAEIFAKHLLPDMSKRVGVSLNQDDDEFAVQRFVVAGLDLMVTESEKIFLLEANVHPSAPPSSLVDPEFKDHLTGFLRDLIDLVVGIQSPNFISAHALLRKKGIIE